MPHGYNQIFTLEKLLDREDDNSQLEIIHNEINSIETKLSDFKQCLQIILKDNEEFKAELMEIKKNITKKLIYTP